MATKLEIYRCEVYRTGANSAYEIGVIAESIQEARQSALDKVRRSHKLPADLPLRVHVNAA